MPIRSLLLLCLLLMLLPKTAQAQEQMVGIRSRFAFSAGAVLGFGDQAAAGVVGGFRFMGVAGMDLEYYFNSVSETPSSTSTKVGDLQFVPNFNLQASIYFFRERAWAPYALAGIGVELGGSDRVNLLGGAGVEFTFLKDRLTLQVSLRFFFPRPVDVEKQREKMLMDGKPSLPSYTDYYNLETYQLNVALRVVY